MVFHTYNLNTLLVTLTPSGQIPGDESQQGMDGYGQKVSEKRKRQEKTRVENAIRKCKLAYRYLCNQKLGSEMTYSMLSGTSSSVYLLTTLITILLLLLNVPCRQRQGRWSRVSGALYPQLPWSAPTDWCCSANMYLDCLSISSFVSPCSCTFNVTSNNQFLQPIPPHYMSKEFQFDYNSKQKWCW